MFDDCFFFLFLVLGLLADSSLPDLHMGYFQDVLLPWKDLQWPNKPSEQSRQWIQSSAWLDRTAGDVAPPGPSFLPIQPPPQAPTPGDCPFKRPGNDLLGGGNSLLNNNNNTFFPTRRPHTPHILHERESSSNSSSPLYLPQRRARTHEPVSPRVKLSRTHNTPAMDFSDALSVLSPPAPL